MCITFTDNGSGIKQEDKEKVLRPFYTTKARGTGLGLAICQKILSPHNGMIEIESQPGISTTVSVYLKIETQEEMQNDRFVWQTCQRMQPSDLTTEF